MIQNLKIIFRQLKKQKAIGVIKITGLVLGMLSTLLILEYVFYERSFDKGHGEDVYRIAYNRYGKEGLMWRTANFFVPAGPYMKNKYPEVEEYITLRSLFNSTLECMNSLGEKVIFNEAKCYYSTNSIFEVFRYPILKGNMDCLVKPNMVAISERMAFKYFGNEDPIGRELKLNHRDNFTISAVFKNIPPNSHLQSDFFFSFQTLIDRKPEMLNDWIGDGANQYIKLKKGTDYVAFEKKFSKAIIADNYGEQQRIQAQRDEVFIQPVRSIHLKSNLEYELEPPGNGKLISILFVFSVFFLVIAWINFINLESARFIERAREIGIKRVNGSTRKLLVKQFLVEALFFNLICYLFTIIVFCSINPFFRSLTGIANNVKVFEPSFWFFFSLIIVAGIMFSTIYPAFILSSFKPVEVLRGRFTTSKDGYSLRKALVTLQFILSIVLITGTIVTYRQVDYLLKKDYGISCKSKLVLKAPKRAAFGSEFYPKMELLLNQMEEQPGITDYTFCSDVPGEEIKGYFGSYVKGNDPKYMNWFFAIHADHRFTRCFNAKLKAGRAFQEDDTPEARNLIINETALKRYEFKSAEEAIGKTIMGNDQKEWQIIGVYNDFHYYSVKVAPVATCFTLQNNQKKYIVLNLSEASIANQEKVLTSARKAYNEIFPDQPFDYFFLDDAVNNTLKPDKTFVIVFGIFSMLALIIAIVGILGLLLIFISQNMRDIGMRKVLGAEKHNIFWSLAKQFITQITIAILLSVPIAFYTISQWLSKSYSSYIELKPVFFILPVIIVATILAALFLWITEKTNKMNVIDVINYE